MRNRINTDSWCSKACDSVIKGRFKILMNIGVKKIHDWSSWTTPFGKHRLSDFTRSIVIEIVMEMDMWVMPMNGKRYNNI